MTTTRHTPTALPSARILGPVTEERRRLLACIDVVVGYVGARHRRALVGWSIEAALVESRPGFRGGETVAVRVSAIHDRHPADLPPVPVGVIREIGSRITDAFTGIANVVPDIACPAPDIDGAYVVIDDQPWMDDAQTA